MEVTCLPRPEDTDWACPCASPRQTPGQTGDRKGEAGRTPPVHQLILCKSRMTIRCGFIFQREKQEESDDYQRPAFSPTSIVGVSPEAAAQVQEEKEEEGGLSCSGSSKGAVIILRQRLHRSLCNQ